MQTITFSQVPGHLMAEAKSGAIYVALQDLPGEEVRKTNCVARFYPVNGANKNIDVALAELPDFLQENPKNYKLYTRRTYTRGSSWDNATCVYLVPDKEGISDPQENPQPIVTMNQQNDVRTFEQALADKALIAKLENQVARLTDKIAELEAELEAADAEIEDQKTTTMADNTTNMLGQLAQVVPGLVDQWFQLQERKIKAMENQRPAPRPQPTVNQEPQEFEGYENY